jgi:RNA polymerase sigma-70 factor, ECF subfamily
MFQSFAVERESERSPARSGQFEALLRDNYRHVYGFAYRLTGSVADAEDLVQETFLRAYRFFHRFDASLSFRSWVYRIMVNAHIDLARRKGRIRTLSIDASEDSTWDLPDCSLSPESQLLHGAMGEPMQRALQAMNPEFRTAVLLSDVEGMAYEEVAEIMKTSVGTVRSRIHRGRKQVRDFLQKHDPATYHKHFVEVENAI